MKSENLEPFLRGVLKELDSILKNIHDTRQYTRQNEQLMLIRELIVEQIGQNQNEDTYHPSYQIR